MRTLFIFLILIASSSAQSVETLDTALESNGIKVEYIEASKRGVITVLDCNLCSEKQYSFENTFPEIIRKGTKISFETFMKDYWNAKHATIFLDLRSNQVIRVIY